MTWTKPPQPTDGDHPTVQSNDGLPRLLLRGLDSLYVCYYVDLATSSLNFEELEYRKQLIRDGRSDQELVELGTEKFLLRTAGKQPYRYIVENAAFSIQFGELIQPSLYVQFFSEALWRDGAEALHERISTWAHSIGAHHSRPEVIARADWAFDFDLAKVDFDESHFASRSRKDSKYREAGKPQTFTFGTGHTVIRIYDKIAEIEQASGKAWFHDLWGQSQDVWRVEFQVRGERLKQGGIRTLDDLSNFQGDLLRELATGHTTLRIPSADTNKSRWPLHPLWQALSSAIEAMPHCGLVRSYDPANLIEYRLAQQARSIYGSMKALAALETLRKRNVDTPVSLEELAARLPRLVDRYHSDTHWAAEIEARLRKHEMGQW